ncbi:phosphate signaling complex protein PhoU [Shewanella sp. SR43-4]|jgi:phosphate transport system protein|uniref:Phosphate-specific transport system accessory protein PhoU n=1 Tax=Shewanella vesiculosa TaxID=518738 RepID=A0ABV0FJA2_9GAMM|nr:MULTISPECIES: phosphate signaling complex protein PhoU [Shewanella]MBB1318982.1 phosphate signaling complex protein PhoU [Shewanella sp. SR43-4]MBB1323161.1 phosphate signaling complex protein PhoU [Shewanella sp. SR43-8]MBB1387873.1 phosphate signaling complex protein PhoU [Shewanella sp. SG44-6]MBB1477075.1 phosphate signaling complex protein PhoU [Shewanella sp. SG41-3]RPA55092.1 phosphate signaling complex protein PhoU [Shewanella vesiculosa]|tara:strand:- start:993 stop:1697 length:705 start_codon:yes stop_codon:yes gene_type:complete
MDKMNLSKHISGQFNAELDDIRNRVLAMGGLVERQLEQALDALASLDSELAQQVIEGDHKVNGMEVAIDEECTRIIAKRQPAASDLRLILAISKTITDLERIGDACVRIAKAAVEKRANSQQPLLVSIENMGRHATRMLHSTLDALARMDADQAFELHKEDAKIDKEYEGIIRQLMTHMMEDPRSIPGVLDVLWAARAVERVGDRCKNICEYVIYYVKGKDVRHISYEEMEKEL